MDFSSYRENKISKENKQKMNPSAPEQDECYTGNLIKWETTTMLETLPPSLKFYLKMQAVSHHPSHFLMREQLQKYFKKKKSHN